LAIAKKTNDEAKISRLAGSMPVLGGAGGGGGDGSINFNFSVSFLLAH